MAVDTNKLKGLIISKYGNVKKYCESVKISESNMSKLLNNKAKMSADTIYTFIQTLDIKDKDIKPIFFN